ncbi:MAG: BadF/BadG/BcrA/BcrD ATPase family protein [Pseudomonadota bacterium]
MGGTLAYNPFTTLKLESDAYTACLGAHDAQDGAIIIIGTGVIGMSIHGKQITRVGGWGFPCSDEGSGAWLGFEAVRLTIQAFDGRIESSPLLEAIFQKFDRDIFELVSWAVASKSTHFAEIAPFVIQHLDQKDPWAVHLVKRAASEIDRLAETMFTRSKNNQLPCCLFGGLAPFIEPWLGKTLQARLTFRKNDANKGAIFMIKKHIGFSK